MINLFDTSDLKKLYRPSPDSHKGQSGKLLIIGGSKLFHGASLWALKISSRIVDMVFYASTNENNKLAQKLKSELYDFIAVSRSEIESYIQESDCILLGPGMVRTEEQLKPTVDYQLKNLKELDKVEHEGVQTYYLTKYLLTKYPHKKWVIDAGALQMMEPDWLIQLDGNVIVTPHVQEFQRLFSSVILSPKGEESRTEVRSFASAQDDIQKMAKEFNCTILLKGQTDIVCDKDRCVSVEGGNVGMTKGGTGDVLAGLVAAFYCKNDAFLAAASGSYINKKAGDSLYSRVGPYFNASDLCDEIPKVMKDI